MVRTDCRAQKLDAFLQPQVKPPSDPEAAGPSTKSTVTRIAQLDSVEMDEAEDADMLDALAEQEAEVPKGEEESSVGTHDVQRWFTSCQKTNHATVAWVWLLVIQTWFLQVRSGPVRIRGEHWPTAN